MEQRCIYYPVNLDRMLERLEKANISEISKQYIREFDYENRIRSCKEKRRHKLIRQAIFLAEVIERECGITLESLNRKAINYFLMLIYESKKYRPYTKKDYFRLIVQIVKRHPKLDRNLIEEHDADGKRYEKLTFREKLVTKSEYEDIISEEEIKQVIEKCPNIRNRAFISLLHETGMRAGEILNIRYKDIREKNRLIVIKIDGKTGIREVPILFSKPYLTQHLNAMGCFEPMDYIWKLEGNFNKNKNRALGHGGATRLVHDAFVEAGLGHKKHNLHYFRHSRATINAEFMSDSMLCKYFGWTIGSRQVATYVNMSTLDIEKVILTKNGLTEVEKQESPMKPKECPGCHYKDNPSTANYCQKCSSPLSMKVVMEADKKMKQETDNTIRRLMQIVNDPEEMKQFEEFKKSLGGK